jgi:hypothetical protein
MLLDVVGTLHATGRFPCQLHRGQQQRNEDCDDHHHNKKFDQRKTGTLLLLRHEKISDEGNTGMKYDTHTTRLILEALV